MQCIMQVMYVECEVQWSMSCRDGMQGIHGMQVMQMTGSMRWQDLLSCQLPWDTL